MRTSRRCTKRRVSVQRPAPAGTRPTRPSRSARRWSGWRRCRSCRTPARRTSTATTPTSSAVSSSVRPACRSTQFIRARIAGPLGMTDTHFYLPAAQRDRLAVVYGSRPDGTYERAPEGALGQGAYVDGPRVSYSGGAGLVSTARDYARFLEMVRNGGMHEGRRIMSSRAVALMTTNQIGDHPADERPRVRLRVRNHGQIRCARSRGRRRVRLERRVRHRLPRRARITTGAGADDPAQAERRRRSGIGFRRSCIRRLGTNDLLRLASETMGSRPRPTQAQSKTRLD